MDNRWYDLSSLRKNDSSDELFFWVDGFKNEFIMYSFCDPLPGANLPPAYQKECKRFENDNTRFAYLIDNDSDHEICSTLTGKVNETNKLLIQEQISHNK